MSSSDRPGLPVRDCTVLYSTVLKACVSTTLQNCLETDTGCSYVDHGSVQGHNDSSSGVPDLTTTAEDEGLLLSEVTVEWREWGLNWLRKKYGCDKMCAQIVPIYL